MKQFILVLIFVAAAMSSACGPSAAPTLAPPVSETPIPTPTATLNPTPPTTTATPSPSREWELEEIDVDGTTVDKIRLGVIGANIHRDWAVRSHLPASVASPEFELTAVCTTRMESAEESQQKCVAKL